MKALPFLIVCFLIVNLVHLLLEVLYDKKSTYNCKYLLIQRNYLFVF